MSGPTFESLNKKRNETEIVRAGAGAGKTYTLTHRVMEIASDHLMNWKDSSNQKKFPYLIVTTFTRKATQELRERLMILALEERPDLIDFVNSRSHLVVSTIHGIMDMYLKRYGTNINVDPAYRIIGSTEALKIARQCFRKTLFENPRATEILEVFQFNSLVGYVRNISTIKAETPGAEPFEPKGFAEIFAKRAASAVVEIGKFVAQVRGETNKDSWLEFVVRLETLVPLLNAEMWPNHRERYLRECEILSVPRRVGKGTPSVSEETQELAKEIKGLAEEFCDTIYDPQAWIDFSAQYSLIADLAQQFTVEFKNLKQVRGVLEIGDLELYAMDCVRRFPDTAVAFVNEWDYWLIDEYQDTSPFQVELIRKLSGEKPCFIVGDPQQSIYLFRGARTEVFKNRELEVLSQGGSQWFLKTNWRSRPELLLFLNDFFSALETPFEPMEPHFEIGQQIEKNRVVAHLFIGQELDASSEPQLNRQSHDDEEMRAVVRHVQLLLHNGASPDEICVLARTNQVLNQVGKVLAKCELPTHIHASSGFFDRREIRDALSFFKFLVNPHDNFNLVELLRSPWLRLPDEQIVNHDLGKTKSYWTTLSQISEQGLHLELNKASDQELNHASSQATNRVSHQIANLTKYLMMSESIGLTEAFQRGLIDFGFIDFSHMHDISGGRESNIWKLLSRLQKLESQPGFNPLSFISSSIMELKTNEGLSDGNSEGDAVAALEPNRINLMTIHASKGLEFKHVIIPCMQQRARVTSFENFTFDEKKHRWALRLPYGENRESTSSLPEKNWLEEFQRQELDEHVRVLYVALTRAIDSVFLSWTSPAASASWANLVQKVDFLNLNPGEHQTDSYRYRVESSISAEELSEFQKNKFRGGDPQSRDRVKVREPWANSRTGTGPVELSVSDLLKIGPDKNLKVGNRELIEGEKLTESLLSRARGTAVHKLMELIKYRAPGQLEQLISQWFPKQEFEVAEALNFVRESKIPPILELIKNGETEKSFVLKHESILVPGQIDLWGRTNNGDVWVVDYKSGRVEDCEKAFAQMGIYVYAIRQSGWVNEGEKIQLAAVFPFAKKILIREEPLTDSVLARLNSLKL